MRYIVDHDYHIHSQLSLCSGHPEQTIENIVKYAKKNNMTSICLTDHFWDDLVPGANDWYSVQNFAYISKALPLPQDEVNFYFGCECDLNKDLTLGVSKERMNKFDFIVIPTVHYHMSGFTIDSSVNTAEELAKIWLERNQKLLEMDLPWYKIGLAHLAGLCVPWLTREEYAKTLDLISNDDMYSLFKKAASLGVGIEINRDDMKFEEHYAESSLRLFRIAKECGCKFYLGSDSHNPNGFNEAPALFERAIDLLGLTEDDKFHITK